MNLAGVLPKQSHRMTIILNRSKFILCILKPILMSLLNLIKLAFISLTALGNLKLNSNNATIF